MAAKNKRKIIEVPDEATWYSFGHGQDVFVEDQIAALEDAPEKRVIELPTDVIAAFEEIRSKISDNDYRFMIAVEEYFKREHVALVDLYDVLGWYLGKVEFVAKEESMFAVAVHIYDEEKLVVHDETYGERRLDFLDEEDWKDNEGGMYLEEPERLFTEAEADELVAGLTALNAQKVKVEE